MKTTCVLIIGTNCTGKTSLAKELIRLHGGIGERAGGATFCADGRAAFAGPYAEDRKHGGVDCLSGTRLLAGIVSEASKRAPAVFCEGSYLDTFGLNLTNAAFSAERQLCVLLHCRRAELARRNAARRERGRLEPEVLERMAQKQRRCVNVARKWASIGVPVLVFDTEREPTERIARRIEAELSKGEV